MALTFAWVREKAGPDLIEPPLAESMSALELLSSEVFSDSGFGSALALALPTDLDMLTAASDDTVPCEWQPEGCEDETTLF
jgi:hypothetical protein